MYHPNKKTWIRIENASTKALTKQIESCPSGALTYYLNNQIKKQENMAETKIDILANGPLVVHGTLKVMDAEGNFEIRDKTTAFCRCGASKKKPYCDGTHSKIGFNG